MDKKLYDFLGEVKQWLFNVEAALSVSPIKEYQPSLKPTMLRLDSYYNTAYNSYGLNLDDIMEEFTRVKNIYKGYLNYSA
jgi:hypothetical protein